MITLLLISIPIIYILQAFKLFLKIPSSRWGILHFLSWLVLGWILLLKLFVQDIVTICQITLNFSRDGQELLDFELKSATRDSLVRAFDVIMKTIHGLIQKSEETVTVKAFMDFTRSNAVKELMVKHLPRLKQGLRTSDTLGPSIPIQTEQTAADADVKGNFNGKYDADPKLLVPVLIKKFAAFDRSDATWDEMRLDLIFMNAKFKNNVNRENVGRLIAFEKHTLDKASTAFASDDLSHELATEFGKVHGEIDTHENRLERILDEVRATKDLIKK